MKLPPISKIAREDLSEAPSWINGIITPVNIFMESVYQALNRSITDKENIACHIKELTYVTPSTYPTMPNVEFTSDLKIKATGVQLLQIYEKSNYTPPSLAVYVPWVENDGKIVIYPITGLAASKVYILRLRVS